MKTKIVDYLRKFIFLVECPPYINLTEADRKHGHDTTGVQKCDSQLNGWYRFQGAAGRKMMTTCPWINKCGATFSAWLSNGHPTVAQGMAQRTVCISKKSAENDGNCCHKSFFIHVKNCSFYYIYKLHKPQTSCNFRYCGAD